MRGKFWLTDTDLKKSSILKADKTGKAIMTILRHVNRVAEVSRGHSHLCPQSHSKRFIALHCHCCYIDIVFVQVRLIVDGKAESVYILLPAEAV